MKALGIKACSMTVDVLTSRKALILFGQPYRDTIMNFLGIHPEFADILNCWEFEVIVRDNPESIDGIGEVGLDYTYCSSREKYSQQVNVFIRMLNLASQLKKPVSIHSRASLDDVLDILTTYNNLNTCLHWFEGTEKQLKRSLDMGLYVSYGPPVVYSSKKKKLLRLTDLNKILVETDGPVKYPACFESVTSLPSSMLPSIIYAVSRELGLSYEELRKQIVSNSCTFLNKSD